MPVSFAFYSIYEQFKLIKKSVSSVNHKSCQLRKVFDDTLPCRMKRIGNQLVKICLVVHKVCNLSIKIRRNTKEYHKRSTKESTPQNVAI